MGHNRLWDDYDQTLNDGIGSFVIFQGSIPGGPYQYSYGNFMGAQACLSIQLSPLSYGSQSCELACFMSQK